VNQRGSPVTVVRGLEGRRVVAEEARETCWPHPIDTWSPCRGGANERIARRAGRERRNRRSSRARARCPRSRGVRGEPRRGCRRAGWGHPASGGRDDRKRGPTPHARGRRSSTTAYSRPITAGSRSFRSSTAPSPTRSFARARSSRSWTTSTCMRRSRARLSKSRRSSR
jgi:hypothetical protein